MRLSHCLCMDLTCSTIILFLIQYALSIRQQSRLNKQHKQQTTDCTMLADFVDYSAGHDNADNMYMLICLICLWIYEKD